ncbi:MAG TPA: type VI secretion system protein TssA [Caulobacteraceae bacterium]|jgi:type VI secretion system protein ImpA|nr:type VI secretion system protein TssA [Caulobacteraceae bacterium]
MDLEELLAPVSEEAPAGPDLAYDDERAVIEQAFESSVSIDTSGEASETAEIDWRPIIGMIEQQSRRTKDVWLAVYLCRAGARSGQLDLIETGAKYLAGLMETFWETVHPQLEEYGFQGRKGPCESLARRAEFLGPLDRTPLLEHPRLGRFSGADFERFRAAAENAEGYGLFRAALADTSDEKLLEIVGRLDSITAAIRRADTVLTANAGDDTGPNFQPTYELLGQIKRAVQSFTSAPTAAEPDAAPGEATPSASGAGSEGPRIAGRVESREDVIKALDAIADYYRRREPASPVPVALQRAREWVNLDFLSLIEDIAPTALDEAKRVLVSQRKPPESSW